MEELDELLARMPNWAKYVFAIPISIICVILMDLVIIIGNMLYSSPDSLITIISNFIVANGLNFVIFFICLNYILPKYKFLYTLVISLIIFFINAILLGMYMISNTLTIEIILAWIITTIVLAISCYFSYKNEFLINSKDEI